MNRPALINVFFAKMMPALLVTGISGSFIASPASGQGLDDLFRRPTDNRFALPADEEPLGESNQLRSEPKLIDRIPTTEMNRGVRFAADEEPIPPSHRMPVRSPSDMRLIDDHGGSSKQSQPMTMAMEIRQARALAQMQARIARLEAARWAGSATLRPSWNPDPTTGSRYPVQNIARVPIYIRGR